ncbi:MAG: CRTAC1 family protein [Acidobacteria bacterium]|nr:CRTAC1 family protein [Acidobacteriota bacterium]MCI0721886.1 CRTAC1 family protein [Acidobacteriota bacterium]
MRLHLVRTTIPAAFFFSCVLLALVLFGQGGPSRRELPTLLSPGPSARAAEGVTFEDITSASGLSQFRHVGGSPSKPYLPDIMGSGVAVFDYDNDGWLDIYLVNALSHAARQGRSSPSRAALFRNNHDGTFTDVTLKAGLANERWGTGVCAGDFNNDRWEDLFVGNLGVSRLYKNNGDGTFIDVSHQVGIQINTWATGCAFGDYNKDGLLDLFVAGYVEWDWNHLPPSGSDDVENPAGTRRAPVSPDVEKAAGMQVQAVPSRRAGQGAAFDRGRAFCNYEGMRVACGPLGLDPAPDFLFRNKDGQSFTDVTRSAGVVDREGRYGFAVAWADVDDDGWLDIVIANDGHPNYLYRNNGKGGFEEIGLLSGLGTNLDGRPQAYMGMAAGDYNHDGRVDFFLTTFSSDTYTLYRNDGSLQFADVTLESGLGQVTVPFLGWGTEFFDYDNDGWLDLLAANGHTYPQIDQMNWPTSYLQRTLLLRNLRNGKFEDVSGSLGPGFTQPKSCRGAAIGDLFNDGDLDVILNNLDSEPTLLKNQGANRAGHWIEIKLVGDPSKRTPRDAIGSVVFCTAGGFRQRGEVASGRSYISHSSLRVHFGLGKAETVEKLEVVWANGTRETYVLPGVDRILTIEQGKGVLSR